MKTCCHCRIPQAIDNFPRDATRPDGRHPHCRTCRAQIRKPRAQREYAAQKDELSQRLEAHRQQKRQHRPECERTRRKAQHKRYYAKHRDKVLKKNAAYDAVHLEARNQRACRWAKLHPEQTQINNATRRARVNNAAIVESINLEVLAVRDNWTCHICKRKVTRKTWSHDHLIPLSKGGDHTYLNVALCHRRCNSKRGPGRIPAQLRLL